jgi:mxaD protein
MPRITQAAIVRSDSETLWKEIGGFGSVGEWHPMLQSVGVFGEGTGATRVARAKGGGGQVERLQTLDPIQHVYRYTIEQSSLPVSDYVGELRVDPTGEPRRSNVVWSAEFGLTSEGDGRTIEAVRKFLQAGVQTWFGSMRDRRNARSKSADPLAARRLNSNEPSPRSCRRCRIWRACVPQQA